MDIETHQETIAEVISEDIVIKNIEDGSQLLGDLYYQGFDRIILHEKNITPDFFDLKSGIAGEILQKFSNFRIRLVIVGDFSQYMGNSITGFIFESNNGKQINFVGSTAEALENLSK